MDQVKVHGKKSWNSLSELKDRIESDSTETVVSFMGYELVTDKNTYTLYDGVVTVRENE